jgi:hypothetical protein
VDNPIFAVRSRETFDMTPQTPQDTLINSTTDLQQLWRSLLGDGGFSRRSIWLLFLDEEGRPSPVLVPIDDIPRRPVQRFLDNLRYMAHELVGNGDVASMAMLLSRPGQVTMTDEDRTWARALHEISADWPPFLAVADSVQMFAPDDLIAA